MYHSRISSNITKYLTRASFSNTGTGKKAALRHAVSCVDIKVTATFAPAFQRVKPYAAIANVILKYFKNAGVDSGEKIQNKMIEMMGGKNAPLTKLLSFVNKLFYLEFPVTKEAKKVLDHDDEDDREHMEDCAKRCIILTMLSKIAEDRAGGGRVLIITDGLNMDESSWTIINDILDRGSDILQSYNMYPVETMDFLQSSAGKLSMRLLFIVTMRPFENVRLY